MANAVYFHEGCKELRRCEKQWNRDQQPLALADKVLRIREIVARVNAAELDLIAYKKPVFESIKSELKIFQEHPIDEEQELNAFLSKVNGLSKGLMSIWGTFGLWNEYRRDGKCQDLLEKKLKKVLKHPEFKQLRSIHIFDLLIGSMQFPWAHETLFQHPNFEFLDTNQLFSVLKIATDPKFLHTLLQRFIDLERPDAAAGLMQHPDVERLELEELENLKNRADTKKRCSGISKDLSAWISRKNRPSCSQTSDSKERAILFQNARDDRE